MAGSSLFHRRFYREVEEHTALARSKFKRSSTHLEIGLPPKAFWIAVLVEEVGKLTRVTNKLSIASDPKVRDQWNREGRHRLITIATTVRRMAEAWGSIPDSEGTR